MTKALPERAMKTTFSSGPLDPAFDVPYPEYEATAIDQPARKPIATSVSESNGEIVRGEGRKSIDGIYIDEPVRAKMSVSGPQQTILDTLAQFDAYGVHALNRTTLAIQAGVSAASSGFQNNLGTLRRLTLIDYPSPGMVGLTDLGRQSARHPARAKTLAEFHEAWYRMIPGPQAAILAFLVANHPRSFPREKVAGKVGASPASSGFQNNLGRLRSMGAIEYPITGRVAASALMFPQGVRK